ncbi:MAG: DM13 domain-containing protein [Caldilineaceae bacterium]|nr:DM13 domain-containing protein [Caldilineaceae bacterium]
MQDNLATIRDIDAAISFTTTHQETLSMNRRTLIYLGIALFLIALPIAWWLASPLFVDNPVDEAFPFPLPNATEISTMSEAEKGEAMATILDAVATPETMAAMSDEKKQTLESTMMQLSAEMPDKPMGEEMPSASDEWRVVASGEFQDADNFHQGSGTATIFQQGDQRILRFENFESTNGPDLHVLLVENIDATSPEGMGQSVDLGSLKGNVGNQNYPIPADVDLSNFGGVMIYCVPFHVVFSTAPLGP